MSLKSAALLAFGLATCINVTFAQLDDGNGLIVYSVGTSDSSIPNNGVCYIDPSASDTAALEIPYTVEYGGFGGDEANAFLLYGGPGDQTSLAGSNTFYAPTCLQASDCTFSETFAYPVSVTALVGTLVTQSINVYDSAGVYTGASSASFTITTSPAVVEATATTTINTVRNLKRKRLSS